MIHPSQLEPTSPEVEAAYELERPYIELFSTFLNIGLNCFMEDGTVKGFDTPGVVVINNLLRHYEERAKTRNRYNIQCDYLREFREEFYNTWPEYRQAQMKVVWNSLNPAE